MAKVLALPNKRLREVHPAVNEINQHAAKQLNAERHYELALIETKRALRVEPNSRELWCNLGTYFFNLRKYDEAEAAFMRSLKIDSNFALAHSHLGLIYGATRYFALAETHYAEAERIDPENKTIQWDRSLLKLRRGDYAAGFAEYEVRVPLKPHAYPKYPAPYYAGEPLAGKVIYVAGEQGIGDTILFSRFLPWLGRQGCAKIYVCVNLQVTNLLWNFRHIIEFLPEGVPLPIVDHVIAMGSLPHWAGVTLETLPPDPGCIRDRVMAYGRDVGFPLPNPGGPDPLRVGISWTGNPLMDRNEERSIPLKLMAKIAEFPQVWLHSFQLDATSEIAIAGADGLICDLGPLLKERGLVACGAALMKMDLVITCCTSIAHIAGVLGVPCWVMLCYDCYWPWLIDRADSPWYPNTRLFRQAAPDEWAPVMADVLREVETVIEQKE